MKAIVNVNKKSAYAHLNFLTFEVNELLNGSALLDINGIETAFSFKEITLVDAEKHFLERKRDKDWNTTYARNYQIILGYFIYKNMKLPE